MIGGCVKWLTILPLKATKAASSEILEQGHAMQNEKVKGSATPYAGYRYQSLYGVHLLVEWLNSPASYSQMRFECDDKTVSPQGLDDIVVERADGLFDYVQVKYTPPEAANGCLLTWEWLLEPSSSKESAKSFLQKWQKALNEIPIDRLGLASLVTNRTPDREIEEALEGNYLNYDKAPLLVQSRLIEQLGTVVAASSFLNKLYINHSQHGFLALEANIGSRLSGMGFESGGIERLLRKAPDWANFKQDPPPEGWITLDIVRGELSIARPAPIPQDFVVPQGYEPPNLKFHEKLVEDICTSSGGIITLVGPPGRGKSTYISFLCDELAEGNIPVARHHYFLSMDDRTGDRLSPVRVARSLLSQISLIAGGKLLSDINVDKTEELANVLVQCGAAFETDGHPFVIVVDGLDHVWRDNRGDVRPLDDLFRQILPLPNNVFLIVGSQPVANERMPDRLMTASPRKEWRELPPMSGDAVHGYVIRQVRAGRWQTRSNFEHSQLTQCSAALHERTHGHPLHVIYSIEELLNLTPHPTLYDIEDLPACPGDDIRSYYTSQWQKLNYAQRDVLHLLSAFAFRWPAVAFDDMSVNQISERLTLDGVRHLLFDTGLGLQPFHESLVVFVREEEEHDERIDILRPRAEIWLRTQAPPRLKNTWHWLLVADLGDSEPLRTGLTRDWVLDRLTEGYSIEVLVRLLTRAEEIAFAECAFGEAYRHRSLKTRILDGIKFQVEEPSRLLRISWALSVDETLSQDSFVIRHQMATRILPWLAIALSERGDESRAFVVCRYTIDRWNSELRLFARSSKNDLIMYRLNILKALIECDALTSTSLFVESLEQLPCWARSKLIGYAKRKGDLNFLMEAWGLCALSESQVLIEDAICEVGALAGVNMCSWEEFESFELGVFASIVAALKKEPFASAPVMPIETDFEQSFDMDIRRFSLNMLVRNWFLKSIAVTLYSEGEFSWLEFPDFEGRQNLSEYFALLTNFASQVAEEFRAGNPVAFESVFEFFSRTPEPSNGHYQKREVFENFRRALMQVAVDVHLLSSVIGGPKTVDASSWGRAKTSPWLCIQYLPEFAILHGQKTFSAELVQELVSVQSQQAVSRLQETCTITQDLLRLCELSIQYGEIDLARQCCRKTWDIAIGYGHRKDQTLDGVVTALEYLSDADPDLTRKLLFSISSQIASVTLYTDGDETKHIPSAASALLSKLDPPSLAKQYDELVLGGDWYEAEESIRCLLRSTVVVTPELQALARTGLSESESQTLAGNTTLLGLVENSAISQEDIPQEVYVPPAKSAVDTISSGEVDFRSFPPSKFSSLVEELKLRQGVGNRVLLGWFQFWRAKRKTSTLIKYVRKVLLAEVTHREDFTYLLDELLDASIELEGNSDAAFQIAVKAQIDNGGWFPYFFEQPETTEARLEKVASVFPARANEFIHLSAKTWFAARSSPYDLMIPGEKLVFFLVKLGRVSEAGDLAQKMAKSVIADTSGLVLPLPAWGSK